MANERLFIIHGKNKNYEEYYMIPVIANTAIEAESVARYYGCGHISKTECLKDE